MKAIRRGGVNYWWRLLIPGEKFSVYDFNRREAPREVVFTQPNIKLEPGRVIVLSETGALTSWDRFFFEKEFGCKTSS